MTGWLFSLLDVHGPSITVDTVCSSGLVVFDQGLCSYSYFSRKSKFEGTMLFLIAVSPNVNAQIALQRSLLEKAGLKPSDIEYVYIILKHTYDDVYYTPVLSKPTG